MSDMSEGRKQKTAELEAKEDKIKADLMEIREHIKEEEKQQKEKTIQYTNEEVAKVKEEEKQILKYFMKFSKLNEKIDGLRENKTQVGPELRDEYLDTLVKFSNIIETCPIYDNMSYMSEEAVKRFLMLTSINSHDPRDPIWSEYLAEFLKKMGLSHMFAYRCKRCDHMWFPRGFNPIGNILLKKPPKSCARCKSKYWNLDPKRKTKHVIVNDSILKHDKLTKTQILTMIKNVDRFTVSYVNKLLPQLEERMAEVKREEEKKKQEQPIIMVTNRKKKKSIS